MLCVCFLTIVSIGKGIRVFRGTVDALDRGPAARGQYRGGLASVLSSSTKCVMMVDDAATNMKNITTELATKGAQIAIQRRQPSRDDGR